MIIQNSNIRRALFRNRYKILGSIMAIILVLYLIRYFNNQAMENAAKSREQNVVNNVTTTGGWIPDNETLIYGNDISSKKQTDYTKVIDEFIEACNQKQIQKAYSMLTKECQEVLYNSQIELFEKNYINRIFSSKKSYSVQSWMNRSDLTYQIKITEDVMATGNGNSRTIEDYYTIVKQDDGYKLNINSYIGREILNKRKNNEEIEILVKQKEIYREYEVYEIQIQNLTENTILMDSKERTDSVYLYGENETKYPALLYEVDDSKLTINANEKKEFNVTFNKRYTTTTTLSYMVWSDIILSKEEYEKTANKEAYINRIKISVAI